MLLSLIGLLWACAAASTLPPAGSGGGVGAWTRNIWNRQEAAWRQRRDQWCLQLDRSARPPTGAVYVGVMKMPVIGKQTFMLRVLGRQRCQIVLIGRLMLNQPATYVEDRTTKVGDIELVMCFNEPTQDLLRRWRTRIKATRWHRDGDYATLVVQAPLIPPITIKMLRTLPRDAPSPMC